MLSFELWCKQKRIQIEILLCAVGWLSQQKPASYMLSFFHLWFSSVDDLFVQEECPQPPKAKCNSGFVRFSLCLCKFLSNEPSNLQFVMPEANWEKGGVIFIPVGHPCPLSRPLPYSSFSLLLCQFSLLQRQAEAVSLLRSACHFPTGLIKGLK